MKRLFFGVLTLVMGAFAFVSCNNDDKVNSEKGKSDSLSVEQQQDIINASLSGAVQAIDLTNVGQAIQTIYSSVVVKAGRINLDSFQDLINNNPTVTQDTALLRKLGNIMALVNADIIKLDISKIYMSLDLYLRDSLSYQSRDEFGVGGQVVTVVDTVHNILMDIRNVNHDCDYLLINFFTPEHNATIKAKTQPGNTFVGVKRESSRAINLILPSGIEAFVSMDGNPLALVKGTLESDFRFNYNQEETEKFKFEGNNLSAWANANVLGYELDVNANLNRESGLNCTLYGKYDGKELISVNASIDATLNGLNPNNSDELISWAANPQTLRSVSAQMALNGGAVKANVSITNPFGNSMEMLAWVQSQDLNETQCKKIAERLNESVKAEMYFGGYSNPQAWIQFVYTGAAVQPVDQQPVRGIGMAIERQFAKAGIYPMVVTADSTLTLKQYFEKVPVGDLSEAIQDKIINAVGPQIFREVTQVGKERENMNLR